MVGNTRNSSGTSDGRELSGQSDSNTKNFRGITDGYEKENKETHNSNDDILTSENIKKDIDDASTRKRPIDPLALENSNSDTIGFLNNAADLR